MLQVSKGILEVGHLKQILEEQVFLFGFEGQNDSIIHICKCMKEQKVKNGHLEKAIIHK